ncbi:thiolase family protein [Tepidicella baoligensis]|uniref:thiolase family protein n=1 Tax=Tepidicella baoligensis TaxID=2707016 RepID=UPI001FE25F28|nr:thiolase family protein [Tepidicella baoligensis]
MAQRICGTGFELFRQAGEQIEAGVCDAALVVGTESMTRNPIAAFDRRTGFELSRQAGEQIAAGVCDAARVVGTESLTRNPIAAFDRRTGFELSRQAGEQIAAGVCDAARVVGTESLTRNPIAAFDHRTGFKLGAPVGFKDYMWEALKDPAAGINMIQTAENLAKKYGISREDVDRFASDSFAKAVAAQEAGFFDGEIVPVVTEKFELEGYKTRGIKLQGKVTSVDRDTHPRPSPVEVLAKLKPVYEGGVQTGGNSSALVDAAAACIVTSGAYAKAQGKKPAARVVAAAAVGVPPEIMGIGPAPAIRLLLERTGLQLSDIGRFEINEAQGAQTLAVGRELDLDLTRLNVNGGAIALGHPLAATGVRLTITLARELRRSGHRWGICSACVGGGQGIALLIENPDAA